MIIYKAFIPEITLTDYMCEEKKEEDLPALKIVSTYRYNDSKTTSNRTKED